MKKLVVLGSIGAVAIAIAACVGGGGSTSGGSSGTAGSFITCTTDDNCPTNQGCQLDAPSGDGYCTNLCDNNAQCPAKISCPEMTTTGNNGDCDDKGKHRNGLGVCEQFTRSRGPNTCSSAPKESPPVFIEASSPPPPPSDGG